MSLLDFFFSLGTTSTSSCSPAVAAMDPQIQLDKLSCNDTPNQLNEPYFKKEKRKAASLRGFALAQLTFQTLG
jgi:hypothetical protein